MVIIYRHWHRAVAFALLGVDRPELGEQGSPDVAELLRSLDRTAVADARARAAAADEPWPYALPSELATGIGWARYGATLQRVRDALALDTTIVPAGAGDDDRSAGRRHPSAEERRLLADRPPHWG
ncbi:hypothetical protein ACQBAU_04235 [Propionibacteriaceae bacterium Y2011]|uniref:hypothetical protein n=1 Tax=Microlunatus sp. Y2014 TaxID=3418488 RepID=UPI003B4E4B27